MAKRILVSTRKGLFELGRGRGGWTIKDASFLGDNVTLALHDARDGTDYAALNHGHFGIKLHRRDKGKTKWVEVTCPKYPAKPEGLDDKDGWGKPVNWSTQMIWALETGGSKQKGVLWCGTMPGGLFRSTDRGQTWELMESLWRHPDRNKWLGGGADIPGIHSICVDPRDADVVRVAVSCGGVWVTHDAGKSWAQCAHGMSFDDGPKAEAESPDGQDPHMMVQSPSEPQKFWVQHHAGIFKSVDDAKSWTRVRAKPSSFGFGVVVHPQKADTAWFVPGIKDEKRIPVGGALVVTRTRDGGKSFKSLKKGLPQKHAYDVVFRHALAIDDTGEKLAMGSTTGNVWVSEDQGESWSLVSSTLPQVYAVRFA
ncbi:MAG: exo-alpha-sialidase [Alphaproteobacteria bacterium]|nr:exo-alpha-sialidase [Alphaproteobacteria bacterium]